MKDRILPRKYIQISGDEIITVIDGNVVSTQTKPELDETGPWVRSFGLNFPYDFDDYAGQLIAGQHLVLGKDRLTFKVGDRVVEEVTPERLQEINRERAIIGLSPIRSLVKYAEKFASGRGPRCPLIVR